MGTGTSSGKTRAVSARGGGSSGTASTRSIASQIAQAKFTDEGGGQWTLEINGVGGAQVLDETGGSRDPMLGRGGKVYSVTVWDGNFTVQGPAQIVQGNLGQARTLAKKILKGLNNA